MRCVYQDELLKARGQIDLLLEDPQLIAAILVQADLANAKHVGTIQKFRDQRDNFIGEL
jgi:hypothetical protein